MILVTGASGFVGQHVQKLWPGVIPWGVDLTQPELVGQRVRELLASSPFDRVLHLAGMSSPRESLENPAGAFQVNMMGLVHLLHALDQADWKGRLLVVSTCGVYGGQTGRLCEVETPLRPATPYAVTKVSSEFAALEWGRRTGNPVMIARPFNHSGPGQIEHYFLASMAAQISALPPGGGVLEVGNLDVHRDFLHVEDVVEAYRLLLERGRSQSVYNVSSGHSRPLREYVDRLAQCSGREVTYRVTAERFREGLTEALEISVERLQKDTGWKPGKSLDDLAQDLIRYWDGLKVN